MTQASIATMSAQPTTPVGRRLGRVARQQFATWGILPLLLIVLVVTFAVM